MRRPEGSSESTLLSQPPDSVLFSGSPYAPRRTHWKGAVIWDSGRRALARRGDSRRGERVRRRMLIPGSLAEFSPPAPAQGLGFQDDPPPPPSPQVTVQQ